jgi:hypothetical protein
MEPSMPSDETDEPVVVEVLPKDWDQPKAARKWEAVDLKSPMTWLLIPPAIIFAFGLVLFLVGKKLQALSEPTDPQE